jgi:hypothetical protein
MSPRLVLQRFVPALALAVLATAGLPGRGAAASEPALRAAADPILLSPPGRLSGVSLELVPALLADEPSPQLRLAQRAIQRDLGGPAEPEEPYAVVDMPGWKSPGGAAAMSLALPGTGQLYAGSKRGYLYLGVEAVALLSYATFQAKSDDKRDEYHAFVGDPNQPDSRFSFDRLGNDVSPEELARLRTIYERDQAEFYQAVTLQSQYAGGWSNPDERYDAQAISEDADRNRSRSRFGLYTAIANHLVSAVDALNLARFNNFTLRENMTLKLKLRPGLRHGSYAFTLTQKF